ncbi:Rpn family recombination-promoting nuclease/putative transposase [Chloroflexi bacterium TSY]|nr:Rpn family recombination-promoting nuclease/putative transposase [Chloroflexi bacterium TSY]
MLFDHQSSPDKWMAFRLLKYRCRIWDESFKEEPKPQMLRPILPLG